MPDYTKKAITARPERLMTRLTITFVDGSIVDLDAQKPARPQALVDGFEAVVARPIALRWRGGRTRAPARQVRWLKSGNR
jgi:hypothetical protein